MSSAKTRSRAEEVSADRRRRKTGQEGFNSGLNLYVPEEVKGSEYEYRWINDNPIRIRQLTQNDDWDFVDPSEINGIDTERHADVAKRAVETRARLVRKPREFVAADRTAKENARREQEKALEGGAQLPGAEAVENAYALAGNSFTRG